MSLFIDGRQLTESERLRFHADLEHRWSKTPAQVVRTESVIMDHATARDIDLSGIYRMSAEDLEAAMAPQEAA